MSMRPSSVRDDDGSVASRTHIGTCECAVQARSSAAAAVWTAGGHGQRVASATDPAVARPGVGKALADAAATDAVLRGDRRRTRKPVVKQTAN